MRLVALSATHGKLSQMSTTKKSVSSTNNSAIAKSWSNLVVVSTTGEQEAIRACLDLAREMKKSSITVREAMKVIKETGLESPFVKVSHVEGLPTMLALQKIAGFSSLNLAKQLSTATASYKLLGAGNGEQLGSAEALETAIAQQRKIKNEKSATPKSEKSAKGKKDTLAEILAYFTALDFSTLDEAQQDKIAEINAVLEGKMINA